MTLTKLTPAAATHKGMRRRNNEDAIGYRYPNDSKILKEAGALFVVADGVGGLEAGDQASKMAVNEIIREYYDAEASKTIAERLKDAVLAANKTIFVELHQSGATTVVAVVIHQSELIAISAGDSQIFHISNNTIQQINEADVVHRKDKESGALTKALGYRNILELTPIHLALTENDQILMCSDGLTLYLKEPELLQLTQLRDPRDSVRRMINRANSDGGADNISAILINIGEQMNEAEVAKYADTLSVRVAVDTDPLMMQDVPSKPTTQIPMARPVSSIDESLLEEKMAMPQPNAIPASPPASSSQDKQQRSRSDNSLLVFIILGIVIIAIGAAILGVAFATLSIESSSDNSSEIVVTAENVQQSGDTINTIGASEDSTNTLGVGTTILIDDTIVTKNGIDSDVDAFLTSVDSLYVVDIITQDNEGRSWYRLLEENTGQFGWILEADLPEYRIQGG